MSILNLNNVKIKLKPLKCSQLDRDTRASSHHPLHSAGLTYPPK